MGIRADFWVGRGEKAEWLGSIEEQGNPTRMTALLIATESEKAYRTAVTSLLNARKDATFPHMGYPWTWSDPKLTDWAYAFEGGYVYISHFGDFWEPGGDKVVFPDMASVKNVDADDDEAST